MDSRSTFVDFKFKGERDYVHGTDLFNQCLKLVLPAETFDLKFTFHGFIVNPRCEIRVFSEKPSTTKSKFRGEFRVYNQKYWIQVHERVDEGFTAAREPYNENRVVGNCVISATSIELHHPSPFSFIETVVAMNKHMLNACEAPRQHQKWFFTGIELDHFSEVNSDIRLQLVHNLQNKLVKSSIEVFGERIGMIYFSMVEK